MEAEAAMKTTTKKLHVLVTLLLRFFFFWSVVELSLSQPEDKVSAHSRSSQHEQLGRSSTRARSEFILEYFHQF